jgi:epoxide hydrolase 4
MNAAHPSVWRESMNDNPTQRRMSFYVRFFRLPWLPEFLLRRNRFAALAQSLGERHGGVSEAELDRYRAAWARPGALTAMLNWYRAFLRKDLPFSAVIRITPPVLLIWGEQDRYGLRELAAASLRLCAEGTALYLPDATHWVQHEKPDQCRSAVLDFLERRRPS